MKKRVFLITAIMLSLGILSLVLYSVSFGLSGVRFAREESPIAANAPAPDSAIAEYCYLTEAGSGLVLYKKNENERYEIASMVKIMTLLLAFEAVERGDAGLDEKVTVSREAAAEKGSELFLDEGESYTLSDLIKGIAVVSANDASVAVAERLGGSVSGFVERMNARAAELGMNDTKFVNPTGYPSKDTQYSTAHDVNVMTRELIKHKDYHNYARIWVEDFRHPSGRITGLANTNKLIRFYKGCDSGKTGSTDAAGYCLSASAERGGLRVVATVIGAADSKERFNSVRKLFDYSFMNYKAEKIMSEGVAADCVIKVKGGNVSQIQPILENDLVYIKSRNGGEFTVEYDAKEVKAPLKKGDCVGEVRLIADGEVKNRVRLILPCDIGKGSILDYIRRLNNTQSSLNV